MIMAFGDAKLRKSVFGTSTFNESKFADEWSTSKNMITSLCILMFLSAVVFCYMMYVALYSSSSRYQASRLGLNFGIIMLAIFSMMTLLCGCFAKSYTGLSFTHKSTLKDSAIFFIVIGSVGLGFCLLNWIFNMMRKRALYFLIGMSCLVFVFLVISGNGLMLRDVRKRMKADSISKDCVNIQRDLSYKDLQSGGWDKFCVQKYLPANESCRKEDLT